MKLVLAIFLTFVCAGCAPDLTDSPFWLPVLNYSVAGRAPFNALQGKSIVTKAPGYLRYGYGFGTPQEASPQRDRLYSIDSQAPRSGGRFVLAANTKLLVTGVRHYKQVTGVFDEPENFNAVFLTIASGPYSGIKAWTHWDELSVLQSPPTTN